MLPEVCVLSPAPTLKEELDDALADERLAVEHVPTAKAAIRRATCGCASAILVDEDPADMTAAELLRRLRTTKRGRDALVIVLSSRTSEIDRVIAFELGADDYVPKPIGARELALRLAAVVRRHTEVRDASRELRAGPFVIDGPNERVTCAGESLRLTSVEFRLLEHLARNAGRVQDRRTLLERVWRWCDTEHDRTLGSRTVDTHVKRLREKLGSSSRFIETIRGVGYRLRVA